jgi:hypothetical protein
MSPQILAKVHAVHAVAWLAVRVVSPTRARRAVDRVARFVPPFRSEEAARDGERALASAGTCLTRALAISALLPGSEVVIGADPSRSTRLDAHAWVEIDGRPLGDVQAPVTRMASLAASNGREP